MKLYHHRTDGGAEYLTDAFVECPSGKKEGIFEGANYVVRIDGDITKDAELTVRRNSHDDLLAALYLFEAARTNDELHIALDAAKAAIAKAELVAELESEIQPPLAPIEGENVEHEQS